MSTLRPLFALYLRSLREDTRARFPTILRVALIAVILLVIWSNQRSMGNAAAPGREFFTIVMLLNLGFIVVAALSIFPSAIAEEKEDETLALLRMTNLSALSILFGKSTSRLTAALLLLIVQVPFTLLAITLGGVSLRQVWGAYAILGGATFFLCNLALLASVFCRTTLRAGILTGVFGGLVYVVLPLIAAFYGFSSAVRPATLFGYQSGTITEQLFTALFQANPVWALMMLLQAPAGFGGFSAANIWLNVGAGLALFGLSWLLFDRYCAQLVELAPKPKKKRREGQKHRWSWVTRTWSRRPLAWKDFHFMIGGRFGIYVRLVLGAIVFTGATWIVFGMGRYWSGWEQVAGIILVVAGFSAGLELLLQAGRIFGVERKRQTLSSLAGLPWSTGKIIRQKMLGFLPAFIPWLLLALAGFALVWEPILAELQREFEYSAHRPENQREVLAIGAYVFMQGVGLVMLVAWLSLRMRRGALPVAIAICAVWNIIFGVCVDDLANENEFIGVMVGNFLTAPMLVLLGRGIYTGIENVAAES